MKCRDFQNEFEENAELNSAATLHLDSCTNCRKYHFEQTKLWEMLGGLNRVEAPKDFDFQLKARIARSKPEDFRQTGFFPALRYVLPLSAVLIVLSVVALSGLFLVDTNSVSPVAVSETPNPLVNSALPINNFVEPKEVAKESPITNNAPVYENNSQKPSSLDQKPEVAKKEVEGGSKDFPNSRPNVLITLENKDSGGGSGDFSAKPPEVLTPRGIPSPNQKSETNVNQNNAQTKVSDILNMLGIKADSLKVISIQKSSIAERSGVKVGDVIEAIDGKKITGDTLEGKEIEVKSLTVMRGGEKQEIALK